MKILSALLCAFIVDLIPLEIYAQDMQTQTAVPSASMLFFKVFFALLLILIFIAGLAWFARRYQRIASPNQVIKIVAGVSLGQRERAVLLQVGDTQIVVGVSPGSVNTLHVLDVPVEIGENKFTEVSFAAKLRQGLRERSGL